MSSDGRNHLILGVSAHYHDSAVALVGDGRILAAAQEERFSRIKNDAAIPEQAIAWALEQTAGRPIDAVAFYESPFAKFDRLLCTQTTGDLRSLPNFLRTMTSWVPRKLHVGSQIRRLVGRDVPVLYCDHHLSHAASAFYPSPYQQAAVLTVDGVGEWTTTSIGRGDGAELRLLEHIEYPNSLGLLYSTITAHCGFRVNSGEYKLMGLAPYGEPAMAGDMLEHVIELHDDGSFALNPEFFSYFRSTRRSGSAKLDELLGCEPRREDAPLEQRHADIAASMQLVLNKAVEGLARRARALTGLDRLVMAGGVALNVVANSHIVTQGIVDELWVQPAAGDAGGAVGAALWASHQVFGAPRHQDAADGMAGSLLGPQPVTGHDTAADAAERMGLHVRRASTVELHQQVAALLAEGRIVGVCRGRMEFGPRALGNRSILADARGPGMQRRLNMATKFREGFRPFAPIVNVEKAAAIFDMGSTGESPYMLRTFPVTGWQSASPVNQPGQPFMDRIDAVGGHIPAVTHVDGSARVQTVDPARNTDLHELLDHFETLTGCPVLVNTSFNVRGEPIVCSVVDAVHGFLRADIDALLLDDCLVLKSEQSEQTLRKELPKVLGHD